MLIVIAWAVTAGTTLAAVVAITVAMRLETRLTEELGRNDARLDHIRLLTIERDEARAENDAWNDYTTGVEDRLATAEALLATLRPDDLVLYNRDDDGA